jgi:cell division protein FtsQ
MARKTKGNKLKTRARKGPSLRKVIVLFGLLFLVGIVYLGYLTAIDLMRLRQVEVYGNRVISEEEILAKAGLKQGIPILKVDGETIRQRLLSMGWFEDVSIRKEPPWRLLIRVKEKSPVAIVRTKRGPYLADSSGRLIERIDEGVVLLPVIEVSLDDRETFYDALALAEIVRHSGYFDGKTVVITGKSPETLSLVIDGLRIFMGSNDYMRKIKRLVKIQRILRQKDIPVEYVDLRFRERAIVRTRRVSVDG